MYIINLTDADKGRGVIFHTNHGTQERGVLSSWNEHFIFARFTSGSTAAACDPRQLEFEYRGSSAAGF